MNTLKVVRNYQVITDKTLTDEQIVSMYKEDKDACISYIALRYDNVQQKLANKFYSFSEAEKDSLILEAIYRSLESYNVEKNCKFSTYLTTITNNVFINYYSQLKAKTKNRGWYTNCDWLDAPVSEGEETTLNDNYIKVGEEDYRFDRYEILQAISVMSLTDEQYKYVSYVLTNTHRITDRELCNELNVTITVLRRIRRELQNIFKKFIIEC